MSASVSSSSRLSLLMSAARRQHQRINFPCQVADAAHSNRRSSTATQSSANNDSDDSVVVVQHDDENAITWLKLNRPSKRNAVNESMVEGLISGLDEAVARRDRTRLVVLCGEGKAFSGGFDLSGLTTATATATPPNDSCGGGVGSSDAVEDATLLHRFVRVEQLLQQLYRLPIATVALVHGK